MTEFLPVAEEASRYRARSNVVTYGYNHWSAVLTLDDPYLRVLDLAADFKLPPTIDSTSMAEWHVVRDLIQSGQLQGVVHTTIAGTSFSSISITPKGRDFLRRRQARAERNRSKIGKLVIGAAIATVFALVVLGSVGLIVAGRL